MADMPEPVVIEMFLDVSCPWCHGGIETNRRVLDELAADPDLPPLAVTWRFLRLHPMPEPDGMSLDAYYERLTGGDPDATAAARAGVHDFVTSVGTRVDFDRFTYVYDPFTAHRLLALVRDDGAVELPSLWSLARAVWNANFVAGVDITDPAALRTVVEAHGLVLPERIWTALADPEQHREATLADHARALEVKLDGVPRMVVGGRIVPTWVEPDVVRANLREAIEAALSPA